jgi:hypothetical protein
VAVAVEIRHSDGSVERVEFRSVGAAVGFLNQQR